MQRYAFDLSGSHRTFWELFLGFGDIIGAQIAAQAVLMWMLSTWERKNPGSTFWVISLLITLNAVTLAFTERYIFIFPVVILIFVVILLICAAVGSWRDRGSHFGLFDFSKSNDRRRDQQST
jgi:hypothetical protein